jgi:hypothetical protein
MRLITRCQAGRSQMMPAHLQERGSQHAIVLQERSCWAEQRRAVWRSMRCIQTVALEGMPCKLTSRCLSGSPTSLTVGQLFQERTDATPKYKLRTEVERLQAVPRRRASRLLFHGQVPRFPQCCPSKAYARGASDEASRSVESRREASRSP